MPDFDLLNTGTRRLRPLLGSFEATLGGYSPLNTLSEPAQSARFFGFNGSII
jgi:hypothetical protein